MWGAINYRPRLAGHVIDVLLPLFHAILVLTQRGQLFGVVRRCERRDIEDRVAIFEIVDKSFFDGAAELRPECLVTVDVVGHHVLHRRQHLLDETSAHYLDLTILLEGLSRYVKRQVLRIHYTFDEAQVVWHERF